MAVLSRSLPLRLIRKPWFVILALLVLSGFAVFGYWVVTGKSLGVRAWASHYNHIVRSVLASNEVKSYNHGSYTNIFFLHHSIGRNLINDGHIREILKGEGYTLWDQDYNAYHVTNPDGVNQEWDYEVPGDNTDPEGLAAIFRQKLYSLPVNTFSGMMQFEVIIVKSCYSASQIRSDAQLEGYKQDYLQMRAVMDQHPDKLFLLLTQPPLNPGSTNSQEADRARQLARWLTSAEFLQGHPNLYVYDLFDRLAEGRPEVSYYNMLKKEYREAGYDHPTRFANEHEAPGLTGFIVKSIESFRAYRQEHPLEINQ